ncbi:hypothetical protein BC831DRAFT_440420 [Entophlyctis helioformis]|nr:hypothetical protein BC831DRAFT_440420 [Entophlyctis helioformis]
MVDDLAIEPLPGQKSVLHGFLGVTEAPCLKGIVSFKTSKDVKVVSLALTLRGSIRTALSGDDGHFTAEQELVASHLLLLNPAVHPEADIDPKGKRPPTVTVAAVSGSRPSYEFAIDVPAELADSLLGSYAHTLPNPTGQAAAHAKAAKASKAAGVAAAAIAAASGRSLASTSKAADAMASAIDAAAAKSDDTLRANWNGAVVSYTLTATLETLQTVLMITQVKTFAVVERVDFPRIDPIAVARSVHTNTGKLVKAADAHLEYDFELDRTLFSIGQPLRVSIKSIVPLELQYAIAGITVNLVQVEKIRGFREHNPETGLKEQTPKRKQRVVRTVLQSVPIERPSSGFKKFMNKVRKQIETWSGDAVIQIDSTRIKIKSDPRHKAVDVFQSFVSEFVTVTHQIEVRVKLANMDELIVYPVPVRLLDIDTETRDWALRNADVFNADGGVGDDTDARSGYIFDDEDVPAPKPYLLAPDVDDQSRLAGDMSALAVSGPNNGLSAAAAAEPGSGASTRLSMSPPMPSVRAPSPLPPTPLTAEERAQKEAMRRQIRDD